MKSFITNCGKFLISENPSDKNDLLFCDSLKCGKDINAKIKIYLACDFLEYLADIDEYKEYDYYIGFGKKLFEEYIPVKFDIEPSKVFDGFVYDKEYEKSFEDIEFDVLFLVKNPYSIYELKILRDLISYFEISDTKNIKIGTNLKIRETKMCDFIANNVYPLNYEDGIPMKYINNSNIVYFTTVLNCYRYFDDDIFNKTIISGGPQSYYMSLIESLVNYDKIMELEKEFFKKGIKYFLTKNKNEKESFTFLSKIPLSPLNTNFIKITPIGERFLNLKPFIPSINSDEEEKFDKRLSLKITKNPYLLMKSLNRNKNNVSFYDILNINSINLMKKCKNNVYKNMKIKDVSEYFLLTLDKIINSLAA